MKNGLFNNLLKEQTTQNNLTEGPTREQFNKFMSDVQQAAIFYQNDDTMPWVEAPKAIVDYYNKSPKAAEGFKATGYFIFQDVKVYEEGNRAQSVANERQTIEEKKFGKEAFK